MGRAGEAINDKRIPNVPGRVSIAILAANQSKEQCRGQEVGDRKKDFIEQRPVGDAAEKFEKQLSTGWINCTEFGMINFCGLRKIVAHPMLYGDPALKLFLESDMFSVDVSLFFTSPNKG